MKTVIRYKGHTIDCYGNMYPEQNISVVCDDEDYDAIYPDGFENWTEAVHKLVDCGHFKDIVQLEAI